MDAYYKKRSQYSDISGSLEISALLSGTVTLAVPVGDVAHQAFHTIFIQKIFGSVSILQAGQTWKFGDTTPFVIFTLPTDTITDTAAGTIQGLTTDFSSDWGSIGIGLAVGTSFQVAISGGGASGAISWEGYCKRTVSGIP